VSPSRRQSGGLRSSPLDRAQLVEAFEALLRTKEIVVDLEGAACLSKGKR